MKKVLSNVYTHIFILGLPFVLAFGTVLAGCASPASEERIGDSYVYVVKDDTRGVTCYVTGSALSCIPNSQLTN